MKSPGHDLGDALDLVDLGHPFGLRTEDGAVVHLLESFAITHATLDLADKEYQGCGVLRGDVHACHGIGGTGSARNHTDARATGKLAVRIGHHGGSAFLTAYCYFDGGVMQAVEYCQIAFPRHTEYVLDAVRQQLVDKNMSAQTLGQYGIVFGFHKRSA